MYFCRTNASPQVGKTCTPLLVPFGCFSFVHDRVPVSCSRGHAVGSWVSTIDFHPGCPLSGCFQSQLCSVPHSQQAHSLPVSRSVWRYAVPVFLFSVEYRGRRIALLGIFCALSGMRLSFFSVTRILLRALGQVSVSGILPSFHCAFVCGCSWRFLLFLDGWLFVEAHVLLYVLLYSC